MYSDIIGRFFIFLALLTFFSFSTHADSHIARFVFITEPQEIQPGEISEALTVQAQDSGGSGVKVGTTMCMGLVSPSSTGEFSSNKDNWKPVEILTINSNWTSRTFYYKDSNAGNRNIEINIAVRPDGTTCTAWPQEEWDIMWTVVQNIVVGGAESVESPIVTEENTVPSSTPAGGVAAPFKPTLKTYAGEDRTVVTGSLVDFTGEAFGADDQPLETSRYWWNFGDGSAKEGKNINHIFNNVGTYTVGLHVSSGIASASDYITVQVVPNKIAIKNVVLGGEGFVRFENPSEYVIDIGGWHISDAVGATFTLMPKTKIHARSEVAFPNSVTGLLQSGNPEVIMYYPNGVKAFEYSASKPSLTVPAVPIKSEVSSPPAAEKNVVMRKVDTQGDGVDVVEAKSKEEGLQPYSSEALAQVSASGIGSSIFFFWFAVGLSILAAGGFLVVRSRV